MAAQPGWFPDPGGQPGMFRYWDGSAWSSQLTANPAGTPPPIVGQPVGPPPAGTARSGGLGRIVLIVAGVVALVLVAVFLVPRLFGGPTPDPTPREPAPTTSAWDETDPSPSPSPSPTPTPTPTPTPSPTPSPRTTSPPCPRYDTAVVRGRLYGGGLSVPVIDDSRWRVNAVRSIPWAACATGLQRRITALWVSEVVLGGVQPQAHTGTLKQQAQAIVDDSVNRFYERGKGRLVMKSSRATTVDGLEAWEMRYEVRIQYLPGISGDNVNVVVIQHSDGTRSALLTFATIGDRETQRQVDASRDAVRAENR
ncbi:MAG: DUF2510 domain-containing protein [Micropruina sp.]